MAEPGLKREYRSYYQINDDLRLVSEREWAGAFEAPSLVSAVRSARWLKLFYIALPILAGGDKFFNLLTDWSQYLSIGFAQALALNSRSILRVIGIWEIFLGIGMAFRPSFFARLFAVWLLVIIGNFLLQGRFLDIALRDFGLTLGAITLARYSGTQGNRLLG